MNLSNTLIDWYSINKRNLPWRDTQDSYQIWLSEIILQQTQVNQGLPYFNAFIAHFPTVFDLAKAKEESVLKLWQGLGYYSRARNLHHTANHIVNELDGHFPKTYDGLIELKGIGDYTASAIASICFDGPNAVVDGNVFRFLSRYFGVETPINSTKGFKEFKAIAQRILPESNRGEHNQAIMEFGARQCKPSSPLCDQCPFVNSCVAVQKNLIEKLPVKIRKTKVSKRYFNYLVFISNDLKTVLKQRTGKGIWQNLYEFPLLESQSSLSESEILNSDGFKELLNGNEFDLSLYNEDEVVHKLSHQHLHSKFWILRVDNLPLKGISINSIGRYPVPKLVSNFIDEFKF